MQRVGSTKGQRYREGGSAIGSVAVDLDTAPMRFGDVANNRKSESESPVRARNRAVHLTETFEYVSKMLRWDSHAGVLDLDVDTVVPPRGADRHATAAGRKSHRVA